MAQPAPNLVTSNPAARVYLASALSGVLLWASFFPLSPDTTGLPMRSLVRLTMGISPFDIRGRN